MFKSTCAIFCALLLVGCSATLPRSSSTMPDIDVLSIDPDDIVLAVAQPSAVRYYAGGATLSLGFAPMDLELPSVETTLDLRAQQSGVIPRAPKQGESLYLFALTPEAVQDFRLFQDEIRSQKAIGIKGKGTMQMTLKASCVAGHLDEEFRQTIWLTLDANADVRRLTQNENLWKMLPPDAAKRAKLSLPAC